MTHERNYFIIYSLWLATFHVNRKIYNFNDNCQGENVANPMRRREIKFKNS
jgi:hypothetical protein